MTCQLYNACRDRAWGRLPACLPKRAALATLPGCDHLRVPPWSTLAVIAVLTAVMTPPAQAQCWCDPAVPPPHAVPPTYAGRPVFVERVFVPPAPVWPPAIGGESITTHYPPADAVEDAAPTLQQVPGALRVIVSESLLNRLLARNETDAGPVADVILGANVTGSQNTSTALSVDCQPCPQQARLQFELRGTTRNQTIGVTPQAAVQSRGAHEFRVTKQIDFDGQKFSTRSPAAWVTPQITYEGAATAVTGVPLIGPLATQIALNEAARRRPAAEQEITRRVTDRVAPRFNAEVDQRLSDANVRLQQAVPRALALAGLSETDVSLSSTNAGILFGLRVPAPEAATPVPAVTPPDADDPSVNQTIRPILPAPIGLDVDDGADGPPQADEDGLIVIRQHAGEAADAPSDKEQDKSEEGQDNDEQREDDDPAEVIGEPSAGVTARRAIRPPPSLRAGQSLTVAVHQDAINYALGRAPLEGAKVPDRTIDRVLQNVGEVLSGASLTELSLDGIGDEEPEFARIVLHQEGPLSVRFEQGQFIVEAVAAFEPVLTPAVPPQRLQIPFSLTREEGRLMLVPGEVSVEPLPGGEPAPMAEVARPIIRQQVEQRLQPVEIPTTLPLELPDLPALKLSVREIQLSDGWLLIAVD